jgi:hypothetical protein
LRPFKVLSISFLAMTVFLVSVVAAVPQRAYAQDPDCTPDAAGGCITATATEPQSATEEPSATATSGTVPTRVFTQTATLPVITVPLTATPTATLGGLSAGPTNTPTPFGLSLPIPPEENPFRTPGLGLTYPSLTPTQKGVAAVLPEHDLEVFAVEVTQGIQDLQNRMPLVEKRGTVIRVYVRTDGGDIQGVRGAVEAYRDGEKLLTSPRFADNQPITAHASGGDRLNVDETLNFIVPWYWRTGTVTYRFFVYPVDPSYPYFYETSAENNFFELTVEYHPGTTATVVAPAIHMHNYDDKQIFLNQIVDQEFNAVAYRNVADLVRYYPIQGVQIISWASTIYPKNHSVDNVDNDWTLDADQSTILSRLQFNRDNDAYYSGDLWYGLLNTDLSWGWGGLSNGTVAMGKVNEKTLDNSPTDWYVNGGWIAVHEVGHNVDFDHVDCDAGEGSPNLDYPYDGASCSLAAVDPAGFYGFDWYWTLWPHLSGPTVISNDPAAAEPNRGFPMMGYRSPKWIDPWTYCQLLPIFGVDCALADLGMAALPPEGELASLEMLPLPKQQLMPPAYLQGTGEYLLAYGAVDRRDNTAGFTDLVRAGELTQAQQQAAAEHEADVQSVIAAGSTTPYTLSLENAGGNVLFSAPLYNLDSGDDNGTQSFHEIVPFAAGTVFVRVRNGEAVLAEQAVSANAPEVSVSTQNQGGVLTAPVEVSWQGSDPDGDSLSYMLQYSPDGGQTWKLLQSDLLTTNVRLDSLASLPGGANAFFRVTANDGVNTAFDTNDAGFNVPDAAPSAYIFTPADNAVFPLGGTVILTGQGADPENGAFTEEQLNWSSDLDGELGSGHELITDTLSPGLHKVTLRVTDVAGLSDETFVFVNIDPNVRIEKPGQTERDQVAGIFNGQVPEQPAVPVATSADNTILIILGVTALAAVGLVLFAVFRMRRRRP